MKKIIAVVAILAALACPVPSSAQQSTVDSSTQVPGITFTLPPFQIPLPPVPVTPFVWPSWINITYPASNYYAVGGQTWTVTGVTTNRLVQFGKTILWDVQVGPSSVGGSHNAELRINLPNNWKVAHSFSCPIAYLEDSGTTAQAGFVFGNTGLGYVSLYKSNFSNWNYTNVNNTNVNFQCIVEIQ